MGCDHWARSLGRRRPYRAAGSVDSLLRASNAGARHRAGADAAEPGDRSADRARPVRRRRRGCLLEGEHEEYGAARAARGVADAGDGRRLVVRHGRDGARVVVRGAAAPGAVLAAEWRAAAAIQAVVT